MMRNIWRIVIWLTFISAIDPYTPSFEIQKQIDLASYLASNECQYNLFPEPPCCGTSNQLLNVTESGVELSVNKYPWVVVIKGSGNEDLCSGSLINSMWVLTSANCVYNNLGKFWKWHVLMKSEAPDGVIESSAIQTFDVIKTVLHPLYDSLTVNDNIALLLLNQPVVFSYVLRPVCLQFDKSTKYFANEMGIIAGWDSKSQNGPSSSCIYSAPLMDIKVCEKDSQNDRCRKNLFLDYYKCIVTGGPLMLPLEKARNEIHYLIGVNTDYNNTFYTYVNVFNHMKWIRDTVGSISRKLKDLED